MYIYRNTKNMFPNTNSWSSELWSYSYPACLKLSLVPWHFHSTCNLFGRNIWWQCTDLLSSLVTVVLGEPVSYCKQCAHEGCLSLCVCQNGIMRLLASLSPDVHFHWAEKWCWFTLSSSALISHSPMHFKLSANLATIFAAPMRKSICIWLEYNPANNV